MNLVCPHCQKLVTVSDENAGQMASCPACNEKFVVPSLAQTSVLPPLHLDLPVDISLTPEPPPPEPARLQPSTHAEREEPFYKVSSETPPATKPLFSTHEKEQITTAPAKRAAPAPGTPKPAMPSAPTTPPPPPGEYLHHRWVSLNPRVLPPLVMISVVLWFFMLWFPWAGAYPGGYGLYSQNEFQIFWGSYSTDAVGEKALGDAKAFDSVSGSVLMFFYFLLVLIALVLGLAPLAVTHGTLKLPPSVQQLWPWRMAILGAVLVLALLVLLLQSSIGFGIERAVAAHVDAGLQAQREAAKTPEEVEVVNIQRGMQIGRVGLHRTSWYHLAILFQLLALAGVGLEMWLEKRGNRPLPRADFCW
jgi:hypothetical protein